jgi:hypothetical protein
MTIVKGLAVHVATLVVAAALALWVSGKDHDAEPDDRLQAEIWGGTPDAVEAVRFESESIKVQLAPQKDGNGRYFVGKLEKSGSSPPPNPHAGVPGAPALSKGAEPGKKTTMSFIAVKSAEKLLEKLAPLQAYRSVGKLDAKRAAEFGFESPQGTLTVKIGGAEHSLLIGSVTPGGSDRYAKDKKTGEVWAVPGDVADSFLFADSRLLERDLHGFESDEVRRIKVHRGGRSRELVRVEGKQDAWADADNPAKQDETAGNWMSKVDRLRVAEYMDHGKVAAGAQGAVVRLEYFGKGSRPIGNSEIVRVGQGTAAEYYVRTEHTRWYAKIAKSSGEQLEQDAASVVK